MTDRGEEWSDWIDHDGKGFPVAIGTVVHRLFDMPVTMLSGEVIEPRSELIGPLNPCELSSWFWAMPRLYPGGMVAHVIRYRVRTPRAMHQLRQIVEATAPRELEREGQ